MCQASTSHVASRHWISYKKKEGQSCVKAEVAVPNSPYALCGRKATLNWKREGNPRTPSTGLRHTSALEEGAEKRCSEFGKSHLQGSHSSSFLPSPSFNRGISKIWAKEPSRTLILLSSFFPSFSSYQFHHAKRKAICEITFFMSVCLLGPVWRALFPSS